MLEINKALVPTTTYGFTLRKTTLDKPVTEELYNEHIRNITSDHIEFSEINFELTSGLHCHGIVTIPRNYYLNRLRVRGWKLHLEEIYNKAGWLKYIKKDQPNQE